MRGTPPFELGTEHRDDLATEDLDLLEHHVERQTGVIHEEKLALVVARVVGETEGALDDLFGGAHGERGRRREFLEGRAVAVHRRVVEIRTDDAPGLGFGSAMNTWPPSPTTACSAAPCPYCSKRFRYGVIICRVCSLFQEPSP